jgi:membrane associated rhomboid family serine protease
MRPPPPLSDIGRFPVVGGTALLALAATVAWKAKTNLDVDALTEGPEIALGEYWRLVTSILLHVSPFHLIFNLYWLWVLGSLLESIFGHFKMLAIIVMLAVGSGAAEYAFLRGGVGLSGVGYGLVGLLWILSRYDPRFEDAIDKNTVVLFGAWFLICIVLTESGIMPVGNIAHGAGAVLGAALGYAIAGPKVWRIPAAVGLAVLLAGSVLGATIFRPDLNVSTHRGLAESRLGYKLLESGDNAGAEKVYRLAVRYRPSDPDCWRNLGVAVHRLGRTSEAQEIWAHEQKLRLQSPDSEAHGDKSD